MNSIIAKMYGLDPNAEPVPAGTRPKNTGTGYYGSFQYFNDKANGVGPPPVEQGGPNAMELAINEGYADETGMLSNGMHSIVSAMYGGGLAPQTAGQSLNPDYQAGFNGQTVGGIGNRDGMGNPMNWSTPQRQKLGEGDVFEAGNLGSYKVVKNPWGQYVLEPMEGAVSSHAPYLTNMTHGLDHIGINPNTGDVWYQEAAGAVNFSGGGNSFTVNPNGPGYTPPNGGGNGGNNGGANQGSTWQAILNGGLGNGGGLDGFDPYLGIVTGNDPIDWEALVGADGNLTRVNQFFDDLYQNGQFGEVGSDAAQQAYDTVYARLLGNLGLA